MQLHGAVIPPRPVLEAVAAVVQSVPEASDAEPAPGQAKGILGRLGRHKVDVEEQPAAPPMLEHVPPERMQLPITGFGNLTNNDANRLADELRTAASGWAAPTVHFTGGTALDFPGDWSVWAKLGGDVDALVAIAQAVVQNVGRLGYFVDRRMFRPMLSVATVTPATTGPYLQSVADALDAFRGEDWTVDLALTKETFVAGQPGLVEFQRIPLGS